MELTEPKNDKHPLDQEFVPLNKENPQVSFRSKKKPAFNRKINILYLLIGLLCLLVIIGIIILSLKRCPTNQSNLKNFTKSPKKIFRDTENRKCFYQEIRLPQSVIPINYQIYLHPNFSKLNDAFFDGNVIIDCECKEEATFIILHTRSLNLSLSSVMINGVPVSLAIVSFCPKLDQYFIKLKETCRKNQKLQINITFRGKLEKRLDGFYISNYKTKAGLEKALLTTHMEPTFARQAFPCFDEPLFKANFSLKMVRDDSHYSLFNMPLMSTTKLENGLYIDSYYSTVKMSTYLVAYMVLPTDYVFVNGTTSTKKTKIRIFAPLDRKSSTSYALNITTQILPFFEDLFGLDYPLPKLDMIAIPDFSAGAMENWGLITYKMFALLIKPQSNKIHHRTSIAKIISHEIAHQWFGNIVTMDWWNDLWLNEGFASYSEYLGCDFVNKEWRMMDQFYLEQFTDALSFDSLINSHPIRVPVNDPQEIESIFDQISYGKGASLVRMLEGVLGIETVKAGLKIYLQRYMYSTSVSDNLWTAFSEAYLKMHTKAMDPSNPIKKLKSVMSTWLDQMNFPLITFNRTGLKSFSLNQQRFLLYPNGTKIWNSSYSSDYKYMWSIPVRYITDKTREPQLIWLDLKNEQDYTTEEEFKWIKMNFGQTGFFRVNYDEQSWKKLIDELKKDVSTFSIIDRSGLLSDAFVLVRAGLLKVGMALDLATYLRQERDYIPWSIATQELSEINKQLYFDSESKMKFEKFGQYLIDPIMKNPRLGSWTIDDLTPYQTLTRSSVMQFAVMYRHNATMDQALKLYQTFKKTKKPVNSNLHYLTLFAGVTEGGRNEWFYLMDMFENMKDLEKKRVLRKTLAKTRDVDLLNRLFYTIKRKNNHQDVVAVLFDASQGHSTGVDQAWLFIQRHWAYFEKTIGHQFFLLLELFKVTHGLMSDFDYEQVKLFYSNKDFGSAERGARQSLELIKSNIHWGKVNSKPIQKWLNDFLY